MNTEEILAEFRQNRGYFPREVVEEAIRRREEITPHLLCALQELVQRPPEPESAGSSFLPLYAVFLLAQFREQRAYPLIADVCKLPHETVDGILGETITEGLPRIIASVFDGNAAPIQSVVESTTVDEFVRGSALRSLGVLVYVGALARSDVIAYFTALFRGKLETEYSHVWDVLTSEAVNLHATTLADDIRTKYEEGLIDPGYIHPTEIERAFAVPEEAALAQAKARCEGVICDVIVGLEVRSLLQTLGFDPGLRRLAELGATQKSRQINRRGRTLKITTDLLIRGSCGISHPFGDKAKTLAYLRDGQETKFRRRLEADSKALLAFYQYGRLHGHVRLRWGFLDETLPAPWVHRDERGLYDLMKRASECDSPMEVVLGSPPGWEDPWSRARLVYVRKDADGWRHALVDGEGFPIYEPEIQAARLVEAGDRSQRR